MFNWMPQWGWAWMGVVWQAGLAVFCLATRKHRDSPLLMFLAGVASTLLLLTLHNLLCPTH